MSELLQSFGEDAPSGADLEYDQVFTDLVLAAQPGEEKQAGDEFIPAADPDYRDMAAKAREVIAQSHDLRAGTYLAVAETRLNGLPGLVEATGFLRACLEQYWESCFPQLDADDDDDPTMRINAVSALADRDTMLRALRNAPLTESRSFGRISWRAIEVSRGEIQPREDEQVPDSPAIDAAFQDTEDETLATYREAGAQALEDVEAINAVFEEKSPGRGPDLDTLIRLLQLITARLSEATGGDAAAVEAPEQVVSGGASAAPTGGVGAINSASDVQQALDRIIAYYRRAEPSSPVPILLERAKRLVGADFLEIVKDMAPGGVDNVNLIGGIEEEEGY